MFDIIRLLNYKCFKACIISNDLIVHNLEIRLEIALTKNELHFQRFSSLYHRSTVLSRMRML
jgi:hypothetical protein